MQKHLRTLASAAMISLLSLPVAAQEETEQTEQPAAQEITASTVLANVNGTDITLGHLITATSTLPPEIQQMPDQQLYDGILQQLIQQEILAQQFQDTLPQRLVISLENERRALIAREVLQTRIEPAGADAAVQAEYDTRYGDIEPDEEYNASHILLATEEEAIAVKEALDGGADFAATARESSTGPSGPNGGELGWFSTGMMVPSFEAATIALETGEVSDPVETQFGWHIITLNDVRKTAVPTLEEVGEGIRGDLQREAANDLLAGLTEDADITMTGDEPYDPALIRRTDLLEE